MVVLVVVCDVNPSVAAVVVVMVVMVMVVGW